MNRVLDQALPAETPLTVKLDHFAAVLELAGQELRHLAVCVERLEDANG